jgi:putative ABC transport system ATP-binding protein
MPELTITSFKTGDLGPLELAIAAGECLALTAASGAGKTRLLRAIADLDPHAGDACLDGCACSSMPAPEWRRRVGFLPAEPRWWCATVGEHFAGGAVRSTAGRGRPTDSRARPAGSGPAVAGDGDSPTAALLERLGFADDVWTWPVQRLSSGETQRLALARVLERAPEALLLDEPTAHLDDAYSNIVEAIVAEYREAHGTPVLWVTHDVEQAERVGTRRLVLVGGKLEAPG